MQLTPAQKTTLKNHIVANTNHSINPNSGADLGAINTLLDQGDNYLAIAGWYNQLAADYFAHRSDVARVDVYRTTVPAGDSSSGSATTWDWTGYKNQGSPEQDAWKEMFMGGRCDFGNLNNRAGVLAIFGTAGAGGANRTHIFNVGKRRVTNLEKLYVVAVSTQSPPNNTGNITGDARGSKTNPDLLGFEGQIGEADVRDAILNG